MAAVDQFPFKTTEIMGPLTHSQTVVPSDTVDLNFVSRALWVGVAGNVQVTMLDGTVQVWPLLTQGWHPVRVSRVWATNTTASSIVAGS